jgi:hypothetical protein
MENGGMAIRIVDGHFEWDSNGKYATLRQINVTIPKGQLHARNYPPHCNYHYPTFVSD